MKTKKKVNLVKEMNEIIEKGEIEKFIDEHLVITATCRLKVESEIKNDTLFLGNLKFERIHLDDMKYYFDNDMIEISRFAIVKYFKDKLKEGEIWVMDYLLHARKIK
jgi:hypothetical protein